MDVPWTERNVWSIVGEQMIGSDKVELTVALLEHVHTG